MSAVCILAPVVIAAWPAFSAAVVAAATSLGYQVAAHVNEGLRETENTGSLKVNLEIPNAEVVTGQLNRDQKISVTRDGVTVTFSRDARGRASLCVTGDLDRESLTKLGQELSQAVVQQYVYQRLTDEMKARGFVLVEQTNEEDRSIRMRVRHWES